MNKTEYFKYRLKLPWLYRTTDHFKVIKHIFNLDQVIVFWKKANNLNLIIVLSVFGKIDLIYNLIHIGNILWWLDQWEVNFLNWQILWMENIPMYS